MLVTLHPRAECVLTRAVESAPARLMLLTQARLKGITESDLMVPQSLETYANCDCSGCENMGDDERLRTSVRVILRT